MMRPKHTVKDRGHEAIVRDLRRLGYTVIVTADLPGSERANPLDAFVLDPAGHHWLQIEIKAKRDGPFTANERAYLERWGICEADRPDCPIAVVTSAEDVLRWYEHER